jgi:hypothetical protein
MQIYKLTSTKTYKAASAYHSQSSHPLNRVKTQANLSQALEQLQPITAAQQHRNRGTHHLSQTMLDISPLDQPKKDIALAATNRARATMQSIKYRDGDKNSPSAHKERPARGKPNACQEPIAHEHDIMLAKSLYYTYSYTISVTFSP